MNDFTKIKSAYLKTTRVHNCKYALNHFYLKMWFENCNDVCIQIE